MFETEMGMSAPTTLTHFAKTDHVASYTNLTSEHEEKRSMMYCNNVVKGPQGSAE